MIIRDSFDNKGLIIAYVMIDVGQDLLRQHVTNILKGENLFMAIKCQAEYEEDLW